MSIDLKSIDPNWITALATLLTGLVALGGYLLAKKTIHAMNMQREADLHFRLYDMWHNPGIQEAVRVMRGLNLNEIKNFDDFPGRMELHSILNLLETFAISVERGHVSKNLMAATMLNIIVDAVDINFRPYIDYRRRKDPTDLEHLIRLANDLRPLRHPAAPPRR